MLKQTRLKYVVNGDAIKRPYLKAAIEPRLRATHLIRSEVLPVACDLYIKSSDWSAHHDLHLSMLTPGCLRVI